MRVQAKKFYNTYEVLRRSNNIIYDLKQIKSYDKISDIKSNIRCLVNDSKSITELEDLTTYTHNNKEYTIVCDYELEKVQEYIIIDKVANKILKYDTIDKVHDYLLSITSTKYNNIYQYNKSNIIVLR